MFKDLEVFTMANAMARHAGTRQAVIARNVAHADTPDYRPRDIAPFATVIQDASPAGTKRTRAGHGFGGEPAAATEAPRPGSRAVSVEEEMLHAVDVKRQHDRAVSIYRSALAVLRTSLGRA